MTPGTGKPRAHPVLTSPVSGQARTRWAKARTKFFRSEIYCTDMVSHSKTMTRLNMKGSDDGRREARNLFPNAKPARKYAP